VGEQVVALDEHRLVAGHEAGHALLHQVAGADRAAPKRRCDTVTAPDFFES
jgi:Zn-dependent peptidase ImmA (M78 family)